MGSKNHAHTTGTRLPTVRVAPSVVPKLAPRPSGLEVLVRFDNDVEHPMAAACVDLIARELEETIDEHWDTWRSPTTVGRHAVVVAEPGGARVVAAAYAKVADATHADAVGHIAYRALGRSAHDDLRIARNLNAFASAASVGVLCAIAVEPEFRQRGYARQLIEARRTILTDLGCDVIYADAWVRPEPCSSVPVYAHLGWHPLAEVPAFWERLNARLGKPCPEASLEADGLVYVYDPAGASAPGSRAESLGLGR